MTTDVGKKMQDVAKGGYRTEDMLRHILLGQERVEDKLSSLAEIIARTAVKMEKLTAEDLEIIETAVDGIIKAHEEGKEPWTIADAPVEGTESLMVDKTPVLVDDSDEPVTGKVGMCGRCYDENVKVFPANCAEKPETLAGQPIGQYHCPDCGAMVMAALPHPDLCQKCLDRSHPDFDKPPSAPESPANSTGIGGDCSNCGCENVELYSHTSNDKSQTIDVCQDCLRRWT